MELGLNFKELEHALYVDLPTGEQGDTRRVCKGYVQADYISVTSRVYLYVIFDSKLYLLARKSSCLAILVIITLF